MNRHVIDLLSLIAVVVGGVNLGLTALLGYDPLATILGGYTTYYTKVAYIIIGAASLWTFYAYLLTPGEQEVSPR
ncbi:DUF378 domain-containing protein [Thermobrachium celere]|uniref:DUF378 domain-containing protein n=1 Tax=Thermobrachium celere DSM 8682 TaxID=941824 RepID=R7RT10_9CLOT|nr:DUF378 domain-containing protein [Thermobrachium celere]CDF59342.1 hypothetical protein TCEL_00808 [Thermobrachium celere DSM 8682]